ncbi:MAG: response regulator transcription factor [Clostridia bacterium]|nr:response regulator transcription factor [Clostridia bacterium]MBR5903435.1 response regulator transcription factor [Clostridia bacterium]
MKKKALVLEDEESIRSFVVINLKRAGYETVEFSMGEKAVDYMQRNSDIAIAILDVMLPDISGFEVCRRIRGLGSRVGIIMLTAMSQETDRVNGLITGADDYVTKPFSVVELVARADALYRRMFSGNFDDHTLRMGDFVLDTRARELTMPNKETIELTQVEYLLIKALLENKGKTLARDELLTLVWGKGYTDIKVVDVNIRRLRLKIEEDAANPRHILTVWGSGYKWKE